MENYACYPSLSGAVSKTIPENCLSSLCTVNTLYSIVFSSILYVFTMRNPAIFKHQSVLLLVEIPILLLVLPVGIQ